MVLHLTVDYSSVLTITVDVMDFSSKLGRLKEEKLTPLRLPKTSTYCRAGNCGDFGTTVGDYVRIR